MFLFRQSVVSHPYTCYHWRHVRLSVYGITTINHMFLIWFAVVMVLRHIGNKQASIVHSSPWNPNGAVVF